MDGTIPHSEFNDPLREIEKIINTFFKFRENAHRGLNPHFTFLHLKKKLFNSKCKAIVEEVKLIFSNLS